MAVRPEFRPSPGESALLVCPPFEDEQDHGCLDLSVRGDPAETRLFGVTLEQSLQKRLALWNRQVGVKPAAAIIVAVDTGWEFSIRSKTAALEEQYEALTIEVLESPAELSRIEAIAESTFREWAGSPEQFAICLRSVTTLLQYAEQPVVRTLLETLGSLAAEYDAVAHYHANREAHDEQTLDALSAACDTVYEFDGDRWGHRARCR